MASAGAAVAATDGAAPPRPPGSAARALVAAALALPGILPASAGAQSVADHGILELKYLDYRDWQPGASRMTVRSPSLYTLIPVNDTTELEGSLVYDAMSGASPLYHNTLSGASGLGVTDYRTAGDAKVTKYFGNWAMGVAGVVSSERDYLSRGGAVDFRFFSDDRNRTYALSVAGANDWIRPSNADVPPGPRNTLEYLFGITQALSPTQIVQSNLTYSYGHGDFNDPYKLLDKRPERATHLRVAHALQPVLRRAGRHAAAVVSLSARFVRQRLEHGHCRLGATAAERVERDAQHPLLHAERGVVLSRPAARHRAFDVGRAVHDGHPTVGLRRMDRRPHRREVAR